MYTCPTCLSNLPAPLDNYDFWMCGKCFSRGVSQKNLQGLVGREKSQNLFDFIASKHTEVSEYLCPKCQNKMFITQGPGQLNPDLLFCNSCQIVWNRTNEDYLQDYVQNNARQRTDVVDFKNESKAEYWHIFPIEMNRYQKHGRPILTGCLILIMVTIYLASLYYSWDRLLIHEWGFRPGARLEKNGLTFFTSALLHSTAGHLFGNIYVLYMVGDNVEAVLGKIKFLTVFIGSHLLGIFFYGLNNSLSGIPVVGASAGVYGLVVFYSLTFVNNRFLFRGFSLKPYAFSLFLLIFPVLQGFKEPLEDRVAHLAHLGGALFGFLYWLAFKVDTSKLLKTG